MFLCVGSGSMCVRVRGEVSLGWPWMESWRRAEVKEEICRKDTHHFPHYYFSFSSSTSVTASSSPFSSLSCFIAMFPYLYPLHSVSNSRLPDYVKLSPPLILKCFIFFNASSNVKAPVIRSEEFWGCHHLLKKYTNDKCREDHSSSSTWESDQVRLCICV